MKCCRKETFMLMSVSIFGIATAVAVVISYLR